MGTQRKFDQLNKIIEQQQHVIDDLVRENHELRQVMCEHNASFYGKNNVLTGQAQVSRTD